MPSIYSPGGFRRIIFKVKKKVGDGYDYFVGDPIDNTIEIIEGAIPDTDEVIDVSQQAIDDMKAGLVTVAQVVTDAINRFASSIGNQLLEALENAGVAIVKGLDKTADYVYERTIAGKEPDIIAGFTVTILSIAAAVYLYNSVKNANDAF